MKHLSIAVILFISTLIILGCDSRVSDPLTGLGDTSATQHPIWIFTPPIRIVDNSILVENVSEEDTIVAMATTRNPVDFGERNLVTYTWLFSGDSDTLVFFFAGDDTSRLMNLPIEEVSDGVYRARLQFHGAFRDPIYARFMFVLPPLTQVSIRNFRYTAI